MDPKELLSWPRGETQALDRISVVLTAGLYPLLEQLANQPEAQTMEMGRLGLRTLLPYFRWDSNTCVGRAIPHSSILCLISLMMGAYPIMHRHGGKIMSELLACIGRVQRDLDMHEKFQDGRL